MRTLIADYLGIDAKRVTDEAHFSEFGMDRYDRFELMILIEDAFTGVEIKDDDADQIEVVGDLMRYIEGNNEQGRKTNSAYVTDAAAWRCSPRSAAPRRAWRPGYRRTGLVSILR